MWGAPMVFVPSLKDQVAFGPYQLGTGPMEIGPELWEASFLHSDGVLPEREKLRDL